MNRTLAAATLALLVGASPLVSAHAATAELKPYTVDMKVDMRASDMIGQRIYATSTDVEGRTLSQAELGEFDDIGEVNDVILSPEGQVRAVVLGVGGFLGLGERDVTVEMSSLRFVPETDGQGSFIVVNADKAQLQTLADHQKANLEAATAATDGAVEETAAATGETVEQTAEAAGETVEQTAEATGEAAEQAGNAVVAAGDAAAEKVEEGATAVEQAATDTNATGTAAPVETTQTKTADGTVVTTTQPTDATTQTADAGTQAPATIERELLVKPQVQVEGYADVAMNELTLDDLTGKRVYGADGEDMGEVSDLVMAADGTSIERAVLDVGGFLGIGERKIAVPMDELQFTRNADGDLRIYMQATQEQLEAQPEYVAE